MFPDYSMSMIIMNPKILCLPEGEDPASFILENKKEFIDQYIKKNIFDFIEFKNNQIPKSATTTEQIKTIKSI